MAAPLSCDHCEELLVDYLLHTLEPEAVQAMTEHLSTCTRCWVHLTASEAVLDHLAQGVPQRDPPGELGSRLLAAAVEGTLSTASAPVPSAPPDGSAGPSSWQPQMSCSASVWGGGRGMSSGKPRWCISAGRRCSATSRSSARPSR